MSAAFAVLSKFYTGNL